MPPKKKTEATGIEALIGKSVKLIDKYGSLVPYKGVLKQVEAGWVTLERSSGLTTCININFLSGVAEVRETECTT